MNTGYHQFCAIARTLDLVGQRWTLLIVRELLLRGPLSPAGIARGLPGVPANQLVERLGLLEARGLVRSGAAAPYELTPAGRQLGDVLGVLAEFGLEWLVGAPAPDDAVLPHVLMRQLELRYDVERAARAGFDGRFELELSDPEALWSLEAGEPAPRRWAIHADQEGLRIRPGACLDADATMSMSVAAVADLVAREPFTRARVDMRGDAARASALLDLLAPARDEVTAAA
jgi:DNA-binding HxlR family transcriptional regulator